MRSSAWICAGVIILFFLSSLPLVARGKKDLPDIKELKLKEWNPQSMLKTKVTKIEKARFPVFDVHNHLSGVKDVPALIAEMDAAGVKTVVNLSGYWEDLLSEFLKRFDEAYPGRFLTFAMIDFREIDLPGWSEKTVLQLEKDFKRGAKGLKIFKGLGLSIRYQKSGKLMKIDDPKLDQVWELCGKYKKPVMIHTGDPAAFFTPLDKNNERWHELNEHPNWLFSGKDFPSRQELLEQRNRVIAKHSGTIFIGAHFANNPEDLETVGGWLDKYPNLHIDIDARISELGRQPYSARKFFIKYQDRIMFGTDTVPSKTMYQIYYRFLESDDEYWDCAKGHHRQGFWMIYGIFLQDEVLEKVYLRNALKIFPMPGNIK